MITLQVDAAHLVAKRRRKRRMVGDGEMGRRGVMKKRVVAKEGEGRNAWWRGQGVEWGKGQDGGSGDGGASECVRGWWQGQEKGKQKGRR